MGYPMRVLSRLMTYAEFLDWARLFAVEPFDDRRCFDLPAASIRSTAAAVAGATDLSPSDFMPFGPLAGPGDRSSEDADIDRQITEKL